jgi:hypothetical protein
MTRGQHLYIIQQFSTGAIKVGRTSNIDRRMKELLVGSPYRLKCVLLLENFGYLERRIHDALRNHKSRQSKGEWFDYEGLPSLPDWIYCKLDIEDVDSWWIERVG